MTMSHPLPEHLDEYLRQLSGNRLKTLLQRPDSEKQSQGLLHTPREIAQQPWTWQKTMGLLRTARTMLQEFHARTQGQIVFSGAGTSDYVGLCLVPYFHEYTKGIVRNIPSTHLITNVKALAYHGQPMGIVHFARSGNSPESIAVYETVKHCYPRMQHLVMTCNANGRLAQSAQQDKTAHLVLDPATNDGGLAMTSSCTNMILAGQALARCNHPDAFEEDVRHLIHAASQALQQAPDVLYDIAQVDFSRACFLGSDALYGAAVEAHLKLQEMTAGRIAAMAESFLGFRHGPMSVANHDTLLIYLMSGAPWQTAHELDMIREIRAKRLGAHSVAIVPDAATARKVRGLADTVLPLTAQEKLPLHEQAMPPLFLVAAQLLALFKSMHLGFKPDEPSPDGTISRVVQGVSMYDRVKYENGEGVMPL